MAVKIVRNLIHAQINSSKDVLIRPVVNWVAMICHFYKSGSPGKKVLETLPQTTHKPTCTKANPSFIL